MQKRLKIKKDDMVMVIAGEHKSQQAKRVIHVDRDNGRVVIEGVNVVTKHRKPSARNPQGGIEKFEAGIHISNVMLVDNKGNATRVGRRKNDQGKLERYSKKTKEALK